VAVALAWRAEAAAREPTARAKGSWKRVMTPNLKRKRTRSMKKKGEGRLAEERGDS
jgi:hypothetical protein